MGGITAQLKSGSNIGKAVKRGIIQQGVKTSAANRNPVRLTAAELAAVPF